MQIQTQLSPLTSLTLYCDCISAGQLSRIGPLGCNPRHMFLEVSSIEHHGTYFRADIPRIVLVVCRQAQVYRIRTGTIHDWKLRSQVSILSGKIHFSV